MRKSMVRSLGAVPRFVQPRGATIDSLTLKVFFGDGTAAAQADNAIMDQERSILIKAAASGKVVGLVQALG